MIYYFSGTGNAAQVAFWFSQAAEEKNVPIDIINISKTDRNHIPSPPSNTLIGFISPTHGFNFPPVMLRFIFRFPRTDNNKVFVMNTRAGMKLSKLFLPGLSGIALLLSSIVLYLKGYKVVGMRSVDLPSNWISLHPGLKTDVVISIFNHVKKVTLKFADKILAGKKDYRALCDLPQDILIAPVSILYYLIGRFVFAKTFYASKNCNNCGLCIKQCPVKAIRLLDKRPYWSFTCESCMHCMNVCPQRAIETAHGFIIGLFILLNTVIQSLLYTKLLDAGINLFTVGKSYSWLTRLLLETLILFFSLLISYRLVHYLRKIKAFDLLIQYTSFTTYKFWRRYRPIKDLSKRKDLIPNSNN